MAAVEPPVVVCTYPARDPANEFVAVLRKAGIVTIAVPSDRYAGEWDVLVPAHDAGCATRMVQDLLALD